MARSHTRKKYVKPAQPRPVHPEIAQATDYIKQWTRNELGRLQRNHDTSICIPTKNGYRIGLYVLQVYPNKICDVYNHNNELVHKFDNKVSAVLYTIYTIKQRFSKADRILALDIEINKIYTELLTYRRRLELAQQQKDFTTVDIRNARIEKAEHQLNRLREEISKIHLEAKYNKVWDN
jgi:hypothetical protein